MKIRHLPLLPCLLGLALCVWRPEWESVAVLALCLCFATYLDNRGRRADDIEGLEEEFRATIATVQKDLQYVKDGHVTLLGAGATEHATVIKGLDVLQLDQKKLRGDMEALRVALGAKPVRPGL